jgi:hypothetical protein
LEAGRQDDRNDLAPEAAIQLVGQFPAEREQVRFDAAGVRAWDGVL